MGRCESTIAASTGPLTRSKSDARSELVAVAAVRRVVIAPVVWWVTGPVEDCRSLPGWRLVLSAAPRRPVKKGGQEKIH